jgi:hypothetical protein
MESAASIKRGGSRGHRIPRLGSKLREFYDSLHRAAEAGGFVPRMNIEDERYRVQQIHQLTIFYGMDITTIRRAQCAKKRGEKSVVGWRLKGQYVGREYYEFGTFSQPTAH